MLSAEDEDDCQECMSTIYSGIVYCCTALAFIEKKKKTQKTKQHNGSKIPYSQFSYPVLFIVCKILLSFSFVKGVTLGGKK